MELYCHYLMAITVTGYVGKFIFDTPQVKIIGAVDKMTVHMQTWLLDRSQNIWVSTTHEQQLSIALALQIVCDYFAERMYTLRVCENLENQPSTNQMPNADGAETWQSTCSTFCVQGRP